MPEITLKLNHSYVDDEGRANLREFVGAQDRATPPIFVGRREIIDRIVDDVASCRSNTDAARCYTLAIQGAPGAGKTSLLSEIRQRLDGENGSVGPLSVVSLEWNELSDKVRVASAFINAYNGRYSRTREEKTTTTTRKIGYKGTGVERQTTVSENTLAQQIQSKGSLWSTILENLSIKTENPVFLLLVDESQNIQGDTADPNGKNTIVSNLHAGFRATEGLRIVPVFAGLPDTEFVLASRGISRLSGESSIYLGCLTRGETEELVDRWMRHELFGFENLFSDADIQRVAKMIAVASEGWPRHSNTYLRVLGRSILNRSTNNNLNVDLDEVLDRGHDDRRAYYQKRLRIARLGRYAGVIRDAAQQSENGVIELDTLDAIIEENYRDVRLDAESLREDALHAGILEYASDDDEERFKFPIPSFFTYMHVGRDPAEFKAKMREHMDSHAHLWEGSQGLE